jgi:hypothetical protein
MKRLVLAAILVGWGCAGSAPPSDQILLVGGTIWTGVPGAPDAEALLVRSDSIVAVGDRASVERQAASGAQRIELNGRFVVPGMFDAHLHLVDGGLQLATVQLRHATSRDQFARLIGEQSKSLPAGAWVLGGGWDHSMWGGELPDRSWIDAVSGDRPVWVNRLDGHMALANSAALRAAGVTRATPDPDGGTIVRDGDGEPTGILKDNAMVLVDRVVPQPTDEQKDSALERASRYCAENGVTSVQHMGSWDDIATFRRAHQNGKLSLRIYAAPPLETWRRLVAEVNRHGKGDAWLRIGNLKGYVDGSLGSHTAAMHEPYDDLPTDRGLLVNKPEDLYAWTSGADKAGLQVSVHAIGDRANTSILDVFERVSQENGARDRRFRVEHAQHLRSSDIPRFGALGVIPSLQPYHCIDDGRWAEPLIGATRCETSYAFRSLLDSQARLAFGSDFPVAPAMPLEGIFAAVTRRTLDDKNPAGWIPAQKISVEEALAAYTRDAAYAEFAEHQKGTLEAGKWADLVVIDRDIRRIPPETIREARIELTMVGGKLAFRREP